MFVCTHYYKKDVNDTGYVYDIFDTVDLSEENLSREEVLYALSLGIKIFGIDESANPDKSHMQGVLESYPLSKGEASRVPCYRLEYNYRGNDLLCFIGGDSKTRWIYFVRNNKIIAKSGKFPIRDPIENWYYVYWNIYSEAVYKDIPLFVVCYAYDTNRDGTKLKYSLVFGKIGSICETDWLNSNMDVFDDWRVSDEVAKFSWCGRKIDLESYLSGGSKMDTDYISRLISLRQKLDNKIDNEIEEVLRGRGEPERLKESIEYILDNAKLLIKN